MGDKRRAKFDEIILGQTAYVDGSFRNGARVITHSLTAESAKQWNECMAEVVGYSVQFAHMGGLIYEGWPGYIERRLRNSVICCFRVV